MATVRIFMEGGKIWSVSGVEFTAESLTKALAEDTRIIVLNAANMSLFLNKSKLIAIELEP